MFSKIQSLKILHDFTRVNHRLLMPLNGPPPPTTISVWLLQTFSQFGGIFMPLKFCHQSFTFSMHILIRTDRTCFCYSSQTASGRDNQLFELSFGLSRTQLLGEALWIQGQGSSQGIGRCQRSSHCTVRYCYWAYLNGYFENFF